MPEGFLSSEDYDERANLLYNDGDYDGALEMLREGLSLYPHAVELCVGMGYARLARDEFAWARDAFQRALVLDSCHEDAMVGMGETLLRLGRHAEALELFRQVEEMGFDDDVELMLTMGRALYREELYGHARDAFATLASVRPDCAEAAASLGYALHRLNDPVGAGRQIRRALRLDPELHEARIYLGHLLYDRGDWEGALREFERVPPVEHWDALAVWRIMELKRTLWHMDDGDARLAPWEARLDQLQLPDDPVEQLLLEVESAFRAGGGGAAGPLLDPSQLELFEGGLPSGADGEIHRIRLPQGNVLTGTWTGIVMQMRDESGFRHETLVTFMRRMAEFWHEQHAEEVPYNDPEAFVRTACALGILTLEDEAG
jgi:Flp pilus assembly protein TadD